MCADENPVPTLITATETAIGWFYPDDQRYRTMAEGQFVAITFMAIESVLYGLDIKNHIVKLDGHSKKNVSKYLYNNEIFKNQIWT